MRSEQRAVQPARSGRAKPQRSSSRRVRDPDAPVSRRAAVAGSTRRDGPVPNGSRAVTRREVVAVGDSQPEPDAPVKTMRQAAAPLPVSAEIEADVDADLTALLEGDAPAEQHRARFEEALRAQVAAVLEDHDVAELVDLAIEGARVELHGWVPDTLTLQLVEDLAWSVPAVRQCENRLRIAG